MACCFGEDTGPAEAERLWKIFKSNPDSIKSPLYKHFTKEILDELKKVKTTFGGTLVHQIKGGMTNMDDPIGVYATDQDAYTAFAPLYDPVIKDYFQVEELNHPETAYGTFEEVTELENMNLDPTGKYIKRVCIEQRRNLEGHAFVSLQSKAKREAVERIVMRLCKHLEWSSCSKYDSMLKQHEDFYQLIERDDMCMKADNKYLQDAGGYKMYPWQRGIWGNPRQLLDNAQYVYVNHEDHLRLFIIENNRKLTDCYRQMSRDIVNLRLHHFFAKRKGLGYLTFSPTNIGTAMRISVRVRLPKLSKQPDFAEICETNNLYCQKVEPAKDVVVEPDDILYELWNKHKMGMTEIDILREVVKGLEKVFEEEKNLEGKK
ncbi:arginine kinase-like [Biomphalaria glabrata]|uniref:Arginine kinase-like n=1 Tax=Biomphalaria glabrata TaxID=6526 RepID=A0A9U8DU06_BIOGL|nr:arginine kinase-like [Biomphalaria glabrata]